MNTEWYAWQQNARRPSHRPAPGYKQAPAKRYPEKPPVAEEVIQTHRLEIERKTFVFTLKENLRGRLLRITEASTAHNNTIIIPASGLDEFKSLLEEIISTAGPNPPPA